MKFSFLAGDKLTERLIKKLVTDKIRDKVLQKSPLQDQSSDTASKIGNAIDDYFNNPSVEQLGPGDYPMINPTTG